MVKAVSTVIVGDKKFTRGDTVSGLSDADTKRLFEEGMISVTPDEVGKDVMKETIRKNRKKKAEA